jgi:hypothetical protein
MTALEEPGTFTNLDVPLAVLRDIADRLIASDPLVPDTWDVDFKPAALVAKAHLILWSADVRAIAGGWPGEPRN